MRSVRIFVGLAAAGAVCAALSGFQSPPAGALPRGGQVYLAHCAICHGELGGGDGPLVPWLRAHGSPAPARLDGATRMQQLGLRGVQEIVAKGGAHVGRFAAMPMWGPQLGRALEAEVTAWTFSLPALPDAEREHVKAWLASPAGCVPDGRRTFVLWCSSCHGPRGRGDAYAAPGPRARLNVRDLADPALAAVSDDSLHVLLAPTSAHASDAPWMPGWIHALDPATVDAAVGYLRALQAKPAR